MYKAIAHLTDKEGSSRGAVFFSNLYGGGVQVEFDLFGFEPRSIHAIHIHEFGDLSNGCASLGGHYNPTRAKHGKHKGDLIKNFQTDMAGSFFYRYVDALDISDLFGRSVVIHELPDDLGGARYDGLSTRDLKFLSKERGYKLGPRRAMIAELNSQSNITGNAGRRIACGIIGRRENA